MRALPVLALSLLVLAACGRKEEAPAAPDAAVGATPAVAPPTRPVRKPGLWEVSSSVEGIDAVQTVRLCLDEATDAELALAGAQAPGGCRTEQTREADGSWRFSAACDMGSGGRTTTSGSASGDFTSAYEVRAETTTEGAATPQMNGVRKLTARAAWRGRCPAEMKPGDVQIPGGPTVNVAG